MPVTTRGGGRHLGEGAVARAAGRTSAVTPPLTAAERSAAIRRAALRCFVDKGYHATSVRDIARSARSSVASIYHHFPSKLDILFDLMDVVLTDLVEDTEHAVAAAGDDPCARLRAAVGAHVVFHCERQDESFVGQIELRSLAPRMRKRIVAKRDRQESIFNDAVRDIAATEAAVVHPREATRAIVTMCSAIAQWYRKGGELTPRELADRYADLSLAMLGTTSDGAGAEDARQTTAAASARSPVMHGGS
jgi:AcrR family transcriptional regulator